MLAFIAILFILAIAFFLGQRTGKSVPDEVGPEKKGQKTARRYVLFGIDVLLIMMLSFALYAYGQYFLAFLCILLIFARKYLLQSYAMMSGIVIGAVMLLSLDAQVIILTLCLLGNFLLGAVEQKTATRNAIIQPAIALVFFGILSLV